MAPHSSTLAWKIPWMEEPGELQSMGSLRVTKRLHFPGSIPGLGRSPGEGNGYPLQYSWASLVDQLVKNRPAMQETWVPSLGGEDRLEMGTATHSSILAWRTLS